MSENLNATNKIKTTKVVYPQIYSYTLPELQDNEGSQKIGYTERKDVDERIREQTKTAAVRLRYDKLWSAPSFFANSNADFTDKTFHQFLVGNGIEKRDDLGTEWFYFNGTPEKSKQLFDLFRNEGYAAVQKSNGKKPYTLRVEQEAAVSQAIEYFNSHTNGEFLWNAKPRFGKTLATYDLAKRLEAQKVLIVTNRPAIANSWFDDFENFIEGFYFISETSALAKRGALTRVQFVDSEVEKPQITFLSLQDLKGSRYFGGNHDKLKWIADLEWDILVIDEAHEGVDTGRTDAAFDVVKRKHTLHLSGTPFKALSNNKFPKEAIFNWTYLDEQKIKKIELTESETGDHTDLPDLKLYAYRISQMTAEQINEGVEIESETRDYAFDLNEFFATENQKFVHEEDIRQFLKNLSTNKKYPFSTPELRDELRHTFWYVGNRVDSVKALERLLAEDDVFKEYKIVLAAGDGKTFDEEEADFSANEKSFDKVKKAIKNHPKTITLSCGQLTTGVTIKEWSAVLMLTDIKSTPLYMQAAFRAQNPYKFYEDDTLKVKESAYLFDFAPTRVLEMYDEFANGLNPTATNGVITEEERKKNIRELLNYFPVISEDTEGQMVELDAEKVLTFPNALAATEIVQAKFMTNLLFNDNIKGVFHFPKEVEDILDKMPVENNKRIVASKKELDLDDARKLEQSKQKEINKNSGVILGENIYRTNIDRLVDNALNTETPDETLAILPAKVEELAEPVIARYKDVYTLTKAETEELKKGTSEKIKLVVAEFESAEIKDPEILKQELTNVIEIDLVHQKVEEKEIAKVQEVQKSKEEQVREHLRAFTRTIPMFIMANSSKVEITIDNFEQEISDEDFLDLTNITKSEFHMLRDGFDYVEEGERKQFGGVFDRYKFNASIAEFVAEKQKRANYFESDEDIFELIPSQKNNQIFTPKKVVNMQLDMLEQADPLIFKSKTNTFFDPQMKSGQYITEIAKRLYKYSKDKDIERILTTQLFGLAPTKILTDITHEMIFGFADLKDKKKYQRNFVHKNLLDEDVNGKIIIKEEGGLANVVKEIWGDMKFTVIVGNPPYNENVSLGTGNKALSKQLFPSFIHSSIKLGPKLVSFITPSRWFKGEAQDGSFPKLREFIKNNNHISAITHHPNASDVFPGIVIKGGVSYFVWDFEYNGDVEFTNVIEQKTTTIKRPLFEKNLDVILDENEAIKILKKVTSNGFVPLTTITKGRNAFGIVGKKSVLELITKKDSFNGSVQIRCMNNEIRYAKKSDITKNQNILDSWKIIISKSAGDPAKDSKIIGNPYIGSPGTACTDTFIPIGNFDNREEALNLQKYLKTKFSRYMVSIMKISQNVYQNVYEFVPVQNFTNKSDIDWSKYLSEIDKQLYKKYGLSKDEIDFIETHVKPME